MRPGAIAGYVIITVVAIAVITVSILAVAGVFKSKSKDVTPTVFSTLIPESRRHLRITSANVADRLQNKTNFADCEQRYTIDSDCRAPTESEQLENQTLTENHRVCSFESSQQWDCLEDQRDWNWSGNLFDTTTNTHSVIFEPRGINDIVVDVQNISGSFHRMVMVFENVMWSEGFGGDNMRNVQDSDVKKLEQAFGRAHVLVGPIDDPLPEDCEPAFFFNVKNPVDLPLNTLSQDVVVPTLSRKRLNGVLRLSIDSLDYSFLLDAKQFKVRVLVGRCNESGQRLMGVKQVYVNGTYMYLNKATDQLSETIPDIPYSFWNQNSGGDFEPSPEEIAQMENEQHLITGMFQRKRMGMPIDIVNDTLDMNQFKNSDVTMDIFSSGAVGFRDAISAGFTEASLAQNPVEILKRFDIEDLQLKALFTFE